MVTMQRFLLVLAGRWLPRLMTVYAFRKTLGDKVRVDAWRQLGVQVGAAAIGPRVSIHAPENVTIGDGTRIGGTVLIEAWAKIEIGRNVIINDEVKLLSGGHDLNSPTFAGYERPITIGDYVWLPHRIVILPGVTIGRCAVVGNGSIVTRDVDAYAVVAGAPAAVISERARHEYVYVPTELI